MFHKIVLFASAVQPCILAQERFIDDVGDAISLLQLRSAYNQSARTKRSVPGHMVYFRAYGGSWPERTLCVADHMRSAVEFGQERPTPMAGHVKNIEWEMQWAPFEKWSDTIGSGVTSMSFQYAREHKAKSFDEAMQLFLSRNYDEKHYRFPTLEDFQTFKDSLWKHWPNRAQTNKYLPYWTSTPCELDLDIPEDGEYYVMDGRRQYSTIHNAARHLCVDSRVEPPKYFQMQTHWNKKGLDLAVNAQCCPVEGPWIPENQPTAVPVGWHKTLQIPFKVAATHCALRNLKLCDNRFTQPDDPENMYRSPQATWTSTRCDSSQKCGGTTAMCYQQNCGTFQKFLFDNLDQYNRPGVIKRTEYKTVGLSHFLKTVDNSLDIQFYQCTSYKEDNKFYGAPYSDATEWMKLIAPKRYLRSSHAHPVAFAMVINGRKVTLLKQALVVDNDFILTPDVAQANGDDEVYDLGPFTVKFNRHKDLNYAMPEAFMFQITSKEGMCPGGCYNIEFHYRSYLWYMRPPYTHVKKDHVPYGWQTIVEAPPSLIAEGSGVCAKPTPDQIAATKSGNEVNGGDINYNRFPVWGVKPGTEHTTEAEFAEIQTVCAADDNYQDPSAPSYEMSAEDACQTNGVDFSTVQSTCEPFNAARLLQMYQACLQKECGESPTTTPTTTFTTTTTTTTLTTTTTTPVPTIPIPDEVAVVTAPPSDDTECPCTAPPTLVLKTPTYSNLGGMGPDTGSPEGILYPDAGIINGKNVNVHVEAVGAYAGKGSMNGVKGELGRLSITCGSTLSFTVSVKDAATGAAVSVGALPVTFLDLDEGKRGSGRSTFKACNAQQFVMPDTELVLSSDGGCPTATTSTAGTAKDNPSSVAGALVDGIAKRRVASYLASPTAENKYAFSIDVGKGWKQRNFLFAFDTGIACMPENLSSECKAALAREG